VVTPADADRQSLSRTFRCGEVDGTDVSVSTTWSRRLEIGASGKSRDTRQQLRASRIGGSPVQATIADNTVAELFVGGGGQITLERLEGQELNVKGAVAVRRPVIASAG
jgi:hypothetical protein